MSGITYLTRQAWNEWHEDHPKYGKAAARCDACGELITIGKVGAIVPSVGDKPVELVCETCVIEPPAEKAERADRMAAALHDWFTSPRVDPAKRDTSEAQELISRMLRDGLITRERGGVIRARSYGREALMLLATLKIREAQGEPSRDR